MDKQINLLLDRVKELTEGLVATPAQTLHDYHQRVGQIHGLQEAVDLLLQMRRDADHDTD